MAINAILSSLLVMAAAAAMDVKWDFEDAALQKLPAGWTAAKTGKGTGSVWRIVDDPSSSSGSKVLAQLSADAPGSLFNLCVADESRFQNPDLTVSFKAVEGKKDQGGGPVWRYQDADNYYIARMNPLEANFRVYKVVSGKRSQLASADVEAAVGKWHTIRIVQTGSRIRCYLNGKLHLEADDGSIKTEGKIGLWTKADAVTYFDGLKVSETPE